MLLDIDRSFKELQPDPKAFEQQLQELSRLTKPSSELHQWAERLRFITSDRKGWTSEPPHWQERTQHKNTERQFHGPHVPATSTESSSRPCPCNAWSRKPVDAAAGLCVTGQEEAEDCIHFIAVSYCWPQPDAAHPTAAGKYTITTTTGTKFNDAPDEVIDRALAFATFTEVGAIWIDQECINQTDQADKAAGVQSMDLVYQNAIGSLGLLTVRLEEQQFLDFLVPDRLQLFDLEDESILNNVKRFLSWLDQEKWFTRAWCMQEAWSAGSRMVLMIRHNPSLDKPESMGTIPGEALIKTELFTVIIDALISLAEQNSLLEQPWLRRFRRKMTGTMPRSKESFTIGSMDRRRCTAAEGLDYLVVRENSMIVDRLAILANLCDYKVRLDTGAVESRGYSFSICAFALAVLNGDLSLMHCLPTSDNVPHNPLAPSNLQFDDRLGYAWGPPLDGTLSAFDWAVDGSNPRRLTSHDLRPEGLSTVGWIWLCDLQIDVSPVQLHNQKAWDVEYRDGSISEGLLIRIMWHTIRLLVSKRYFHLAQVIWDHEGDLQLQIASEQSDNDAIAEGASYIDLPRQIGRLIHLDTNRFIFEHPSICDERQFLDGLKRKRRIRDTILTKRNWLVEAIMTGRLTCGKQLSQGASFSSVQSSVSAGQIGNLQASSGPPTSVCPPQNPSAEDMVPGTPNLKSDYTIVVGSIEAFRKAVFCPSFQYRPDPRETLHTWRPSYWLADRLFRQPDVELWKIIGGQMMRGYSEPQTMFSSCFLS